MLVPFTFWFDSTGIHPGFFDNKKFMIVAEGVSAMARGVFVYLGERLRRAGLR